MKKESTFECGLVKLQLNLILPINAVEGQDLLGHVPSHPFVEPGLCQVNCALGGAEKGLDRLWADLPTEIGVAVFGVGCALADVLVVHDLGLVGGEVHWDIVLGPVAVVSHLFLAKVLRVVFDRGLGSEAAARLAEAPANLQEDEKLANLVLYC